MTRHLIAVAALCVIAAPPLRGAEALEFEARDFTSTRYLDAEQLEKIHNVNRLTGNGEVDYRFDIQDAGWYELWVEANDWATDLFLDNDFIMHSPLKGGVLPADGKLEKVVNLYLDRGEHTLRFSRTWFPGLPWLHRFVLKPATSLSGMVRVSPRSDALCFRRGEELPLRVRVGRQTEPATVMLVITPPDGDRIVHRQAVRIPAGTGNVEKAVAVPLDTEGVFDLHIQDQQGRALDRIIQVLTVDTENRDPAPDSLTLKEVQSIDCAGTEPSYQKGETRIIDSPLGRYRESGKLGNAEHGMNANWFAYTLQLPQIQVPYLLEIDYPDDDERTFTYAVAENNMPGGRALTHGVASGGRFSLSHEMQTARMVFYPRQKDPRILIRNWWTGQRAATAAIRVYRVRGGFPELQTDSRREYGRYQEEPIRYVQWGAQHTEGNTWQNLWNPADRIGAYSKYAGVNFWQPTIAIYGATMWPSKYLPSLSPDSDAWGVGGPRTLKEPLAKDTVRLCLLAAEKYDMRLLGELYMPCTRTVARKYFEERFGGDGDIEWKDPSAKPWLLVHRTGKSPGTPTFNPLYPGIQEWVADIVRELAQRYADSPAYAGVGIRFMSWQFHAWQGFPSLDWGYGDDTIAAFERETGIDVPVASQDANRFQKRYEWLLAHHYDRWVSWRCEKVYDYHADLAEILAAARADLKLYLDLHGATFGGNLDTREYDRKGWTKLVRETGLDPARYRRNPAIIMRDRRHYPPGIRGVSNKPPVERAAAVHQFYDTEPIEKTAERTGDGMIGRLHFDANSFESNMIKARELDLVSPKPESDLHGAGLVFPAGRHFLERYAVSMADGNLISITDGSHGYICQPPEWTRAFTREYRGLPKIPMTRVGDGDPAALWQGTRDGKTYFYLVNRCDYPVTATVSLPSGAQVQRLVTGERVGSTPLRITLEPYALLGFVNNAGKAPTTVGLSIPESEVTALKEQLAHARRIVSLSQVKDPLIPFSKVDLQKARERVDAAEHALKAENYWRASRLLYHHDVVRLYTALDAWPPGLLHRKAPDAPQGAMLPADLIKRVRRGDKSNVRVRAATTLVPALTGVDLLSWSGGSLQLGLTLPVANRYRFSYACLNGEKGEMPHLSVGERSMKAQFYSENDAWQRVTLREPLALAAGTRTVAFTCENGASSAALFYLDVQPSHRPLPAEEWVGIGPFPSKWKRGSVPTGMNIAYPPETVRDFSATYPGRDNASVSWHPLEGNDGYVDIYQTTQAFTQAVSYATTTVVAPEKRPAELTFGLDYWGTVWVNGEQVFHQTEGHGAPKPAQFNIPVTLRKGRNEIVVKINAGSRGNGFWMSISDPGDLVVQRPVAP